MRCAPPIPKARGCSSPLTEVAGPSWTAAALRWPGPPSRRGSTNSARLAPQPRPRLATPPRICFCCSRNWWRAQAWRQTRTSTWSCAIVAPAPRWCACTRGRGPHAPNC
ncbi:hypothetical protein SE17_13295 [Kouleothrix aurantiaca]|uniref:Uncharacterized protein n=1 Tax=Kouleothrix aurantiaca TaxID=186479 RepID=A0A0P9FI72_9CHLR|nr:hypothetical protein SE17_13295 [Kouleothrix aurantiaca]